MIETNRSSFRARNRAVVLALVLFSLIAGLIGCGGGGGGGTGGPGGGTGTIPDAPTNLVATPGNGQVSLTWSASSGASSYNVLRALSGAGPFTTVINAVTDTAYTNSGLTNGTTYFYKVTATNINGTSGDSNIASATPVSVGGGGSWLPVNTIFYNAVDASDSTATDLRRINPDGSGDALFKLVPNQFAAVAANPNINNQLVFAHTTDAVVTATSTYSIFRNTTVSLSGAVKLSDAGTNAFNLVGSIGFTLDGQKIFFTAEVGSDHGLYVMNPNGTSLARIASADDASLSPDGTKILISVPQGSQDDIYYINTSELSSGSPTLHAVLVTATTDEIMPQWSKDGTKIVFSAADTTDLTPNYEVFVRGFSSGSPVQVSANGDNNLSPSVSADNSQVAYVRVSSTVGDTGVYRTPIGGGSENIVILDASVQTGLYWTSNTGRAVGGIPLSFGRTLKRIRLN